MRKRHISLASILGLCLLIGLPGSTWANKQTVHDFILSSEKSDSAFSKGVHAYDPADYATALQLWLAAAEKGDSLAQLAVGLLYADGRGVKQNNQHAYKWIRRAAEQDNMDAQYELRLMYLDGRGVQKNKVQARHWLERASANGHFDATWLSPSTDKEFTDQLDAHTSNLSRLIKKAEQGDVNAQLELGYFFLKGYQPDYERAATWFRQAAERGNPQAQENLGWLYYKGLGVNKDTRESARWYELAAKHGEPRLQTYVGDLYLYGNGVQKDETGARLWYWLAADQDYPDAQNKLGLMYLEGISVKPDEKQAYDWFSKAARKDHPKAQAYLGWMYHHGLGVPPDPERAIKWYTLSINQGDVDALNYLGYMFQDGVGFKSDPVPAYALYRRAQSLKRGSKMANKNLIEVTETMTQKQVNQAEALSREMAGSDNLWTPLKRYLQTSSVPLSQ